MFDYETRLIADGIAIVSVRGTLNQETRAYFFECVGGLIEDGYERIIIECHGLGFVSSSGLAGLLKARRRVQAHSGKIYLTHLNSTVTEALQLTKLNSLFAIYPTTRKLLAKLQDADNSVVTVA